MMVLLPALLVVTGRWIFGPARTGHRRWAVGAGSGLAVGAGLGIVGQVGSVLPLVIVGLLVFAVSLITLLQVGIEHWTRLHGRPEFGSAEPTQGGLWARVGSFIAPRPRRVWVVTAAVLAIGALGLMKLDANGLTTEDSFTTELKSVTAMNLLADHKLTNQTNTVQVVGDAGRIDQLRTAVGDVQGIGTLTDTRPLADGRAWFEGPIAPDVASQDAWDIVLDARAAAHKSDSSSLVGGQAAFYLDTKIASQHDRKIIIPLVLAVVLLILMMLLRALAAPLLLLGTVILSFASALGISTLIFDYVLGFHGADSGFPLFAFVFLVALGIDYNIFLMTRVREESLQHGTRKGSLVALASTGGVITSAGMVLAATFLVLGTLPMVFLAELGLAVALGVLLDTMIVRSVLVTAINIDLGDKIWWPSKLGQDKVDPEETAELVNA
ncbi:hypothetical protein EPD65_15060 [Nocardioides jejuensis]|uniref:Membrane transport protein MMPL domain-containing protein n=2 Tax=Nocardioides jejuensis TaxID=2502782 RepID=A0A4R1BU96_9ACTN|nr:hypothetical protein EPD65_15060 [Nocardioides jejuensis]